MASLLRASLGQSSEGEKASLEASKQGHGGDFASERQLFGTIAARALANWTREVQVKRLGSGLPL